MEFLTNNNSFILFSNNNNRLFELFISPFNNLFSFSNISIFFKYLSSHIFFISFSVLLVTEFILLLVFLFILFVLIVLFKTFFGVTSLLLLLFDIV